MNQRILSVLLALCLCLSPQSVAHASPEDILPQENIFLEESIEGSDADDDVISVPTEEAIDESDTGDNVIPVSLEELSLQANVFAERSTAEPDLHADSTIPTPTEAYEAMTALKNKDMYKEGAVWTNYEPYSDSKGYYNWKGGPLDGKNIVAAGCVAFAFTLSDEAFGSLPARMYATNQFSFEDIKVGDILRVNTDTHTVIVLEVSAAGVVLAEGNYNGKVHWGRTMSKDEVMRDTSHYITRYPEGYVSPDDPEANESIAKGTLTGGLTWDLTKAGTLTISGNGAMPDYSSAGDQPWNEYSSQIRTVLIEDGVTSIGNCAFWTCGVLDVRIAASVTTIGNSAFRGSSIISVDIPSSVKTIGDSAFRECKNLRSVTVSEGVERIVQNAFRACTGLISIDLPASIGEVGAGAFFECTEMKSASFAPGSKQVKLGDDMFTRCYYLMSVTLPSSIDRIGDRMFMNCGKLYGVEIPRGAESIGEGAFASSGVVGIIIPDSVTTIGSAAFSACPLTDIYFSGTESQWKKIGKLGDTASAVSKVTIHYNSKPVHLESSTEVSLKNDTLTYGETLAKLEFNSTEFVDNDGKTVTGTLKWKDGKTVPDAGTTSAEWIFNPDDIQYASVEGAVAITVNKAVPYIVVLPTAEAITYGDTLADSALSGGTVQYGNGAGQAGNGTDSTKAIAGTFTWKDSSAKPTVADSGRTEFAVVFTPSDTKNYETVEGRITLTVYKGGNAPNMPGSAMDVSNSIQKVGDIILPKGWEWQDTDKDTPLEIGETVNAVAVYTGADKGSYENETVTVTIKKSACEHTAGDILYTGTGEKAPTCTEAGLGHRECAICGSVVESGIVIDALGHDYKGTVTKEPTVAEEGVMTYTCSRCGHSYTSPIEKLPDNGSDKPEKPGGDNKPDDNNPGDNKPEGNEPGNNQPDVGQPGDNRPGNSNTEQEPRPDTGIPFIKGEDGKFGWDVIRADEENAVEGSVINVNMNGASVVPGDIFDSIKGRNITITFDMGNGILWSVNGKSITTEQAGDIDFSVRTGTNAIPADIIHNAIGEGYSIQLSLSHEGEFGFTAVLSINLGKENAGRTAVLYYYNRNTRALELICKERAAEDGTARLTFTHASDYLLVVDDRASSGNESITSGTQVTAPKSGDWEDGSLWWILMAGALAVIIDIYFRKKRRRQ